MYMGNADMRWQFGGNFEPVRIICEENWKECPTAVLNYVWSEVVTEVVDCLSNDVLLWRVIAMMVLFLMLIHTVYYKLRWIDETSINRENLNRVGFKVQDLELKVNILTYKMQYGTWPLPHHILKSGMGNELHNVRLTLSNTEERNSWIKHLLLSPRKKKNCSLYNNALSQSVKCMTKIMNLETKYVSSKFKNEVSPNESRHKAIKNNNESTTRKWKRCKKCLDITFSKQRQISKSENLGLRHRHGPKSILLIKKEKTDSQSTDKNESNEQDKFKNPTNREQNSELSERYSESTTTCSERNEEMQLERESSDLSQESDIHYKTEKGGEGCLEKADEPKMERLRTENDLQLHEDDINSTNKIQESGKSTNENFYSLKENDTLENILRNENRTFLPPNLSITFLTETFPKTSSFDKATKSIFDDTSKQHSLTSTQETLLQVKGKLESLHNVFLAYESKEGNQNEGSCVFKDYVLHKDAKSKKSSKVSFNFDVAKDLITDDETLNSSEYEQCESIIQSSSTSLSLQSYSNMFNIHRKVHVQNPYYNQSDPTDSSSEEKSKLKNSSNGSINTFTKIQFESRDNLSELNSDYSFNSDLALQFYNVNLNIDRITTSHNQNYILDHKMENYPMDTSDDQISRSSSQIEFSTDENSDNQSTSALLQEALQFKDALLSQLELEKELKISQKKVNKDEEYDFRKNSWAKVDNYFQTKILDIITEEQSAGSSTEKTNKTFVMRQLGQHNFSHQTENSKSAIGSTSSEYFSFSNLSQKESEDPREYEIVSDKEDKNQFQLEVPLSKNKRGLDTEIRPNNLVKRSKYMTQGDEGESLNEEKKNEGNSEEKILLSSKLIRNFKEEQINEEKEEKMRKDKEENKKQHLNNLKSDSHFQKVEDENSNAISQRYDTPSDESLTQFIREFGSNKAKAVNIFRESKLDFNSKKSEDKSSSINDTEKPESTFTLQRSPGSFSLTENQPKQNSFKTFDSDSHSYFEPANSEMELELSTHYPLPKFISGEIESDLVTQTKEKQEEFEIIEVEHPTDEIIYNNIHMNKNQNIESEFNFDLKDPELSSRSVNTVTDKSTCENFREESIKKENDQELIPISETKSEVKLQELVENKSEYSLKEEISENLDSEEKVDKSKSNLTSETSSNLYFTAEPSSSDIKLNFKYLTSSTSVSKSNLEIQETIVEDLNESLPENKTCENDCVKIEESKVSEAMLIDLSDVTPGEQSPTQTPKTYRKISENENSETDNLHILDAVVTEKIEENSCLIPKKINQKNESENNFDGNESRSYAESKDQNLTSQSCFSIFETTNNKFPNYSSAPSLQGSPWNVEKNWTIQSSIFVKSNRNLQVVEKSKTLSKRPSTKEDSTKNTKNRKKLNENSNKGKKKMKTNLNLNLGKQSSGDQSQGRSRSFVSPQLKQISPESSASTKSARDPMEVNQQTKLTSRTSIKSIESQKSSRSCIPVLKTRLENIRKTKHTSRSRSPPRGPLTISVRNHDSDSKNAREFKTRRESKGEKNDSNEKSFGDNTDTATNLLVDLCPEPNEKTVIYVNIMTDQYQSKRKIVDPKKFLEYVENKDLKIQNIISDDQSEDLVIEDDLPRRNMQRKFSFQVEKKEREVSVKPTVMDNCTSVSDFSEFFDDDRQKKSKFQIFQVPEELTKEEYIKLLDTLIQDPNLEELRKMHKLCSKLGVGFQE